MVGESIHLGLIPEWMMMGTVSFTSCITVIAAYTGHRIISLMLLTTFTGTPHTRSLPHDAPRDTLCCHYVQCTVHAANCINSN